MDDPDRAAASGFRGDMADIESVGATADASVGDGRDARDEPAPGDGAGRGEHFAHAGSADGALVADDDHVARDDVAAKDAFERVFLAFVNLGFALKVEALLAGDFSDGAGGGEIAAQDAEVGVGLDRVVPGTDDVLLIR